MGAAPRLPITWGPDVLRPARERAGLSRAALSRAAGVCDSTIKKLERASHAATVAIAVRLCRVLRLPSPAAGPALSIPLGGCDAAAAARVLRQALQEFAAQRSDPARFVEPDGWQSFIEYTLQLHATQAEAEIAETLARGLKETADG